MELSNNKPKPDIKLLASNGKLLKYFNEIIFGNYDDGQLHNFLIVNESIKNTFFIVSESDDESSMASFIKNNITATNMLKNFIDIPETINEEDIIFSPTNYSILVLNVISNQKGIEINTLGLFEWLLSNMLYTNSVDSIGDSLKLLNTDDFNLYALNYTDISKSFADILKDENLQEILTTDSL